MFHPRAPQPTTCNAQGAGTALAADAPHAEGPQAGQVDLDLAVPEILAQVLQILLGQPVGQVLDMQVICREFN